MKRIFFGLAAAAAIAVCAGTASAQSVIVPAYPQTVVPVVPAPPVVIVQNPPVVVSPIVPTIRLGYPYYYGRPYYWGGYHRHW